MARESRSEASGLTPRMSLIAQGRDWRLHEHICTAGPEDRAFEERHDGYSIAAVIEGTFTYRGATGSALLHPGALLLGNHAACFECGHAHSRGDRCVALAIAPALFEEIAASAVGSALFRFPAGMLPALPALQPWVARLEARRAGRDPAQDEEFALALIETVLGAIAGTPQRPARPSAAETRRIGAAIRAVEENAADALSLDHLAARAGMSKYHFLRTFRRVTATTPYRFLLDTRLRRAAVRLLTTKERISDLAFDCGFGDLSTFNARFKRRFGKSPGEFRRG